MTINYENLEDKLNNGMYQLIDENAYNAIGFMPDVHGDVETLYELGYTLAKKAEGKDVYISIQDVDSKTDRLKLFQTLGLKDTNVLVSDFISNKFEDENEKSLVKYIFAIDSHGGFDNYLKLISEYYGIDEEQKNLEIKRYEESITYFKNSGLQDKIIQIQKQNKSELQELVSQNQLILLSYDRAFSHYNAAILATKISELNKQLNNEELGEVKLIVGGGNHDNEFDISLLKHYLGNDKVHNIRDLEGSIQLGEDGENKLKFQVSGNVYGISHRFEKLIYGEEELRQLYPLMEGENKEALVENYDPSSMHINLEDALKSIEYRRITSKKKQETSLDFLLVHSEFGEPIGLSGKSRYSAIDNIGLLYLTQNNLEKDEEGNVTIYSGHIHSPKSQIDYDLKQNKHRVYASIISKNEFEKLDSKRISDNGDVSSNYDLDEIKNLANKYYEQFSMGKN